MTRFDEKYREATKLGYRLHDRESKRNPAPQCQANLYQSLQAIDAMHSLFLTNDNVDEFSSRCSDFSIQHGRFLTPAKLQEFILMVAFIAYDRDNPVLAKLDRYATNQPKYELGANFWYDQLDNFTDNPGWNLTWDRVNDKNFNDNNEKNNNSNKTKTTTITKQQQ